MTENTTTTGENSDDSNATVAIVATLVVSVIAAAGIAMFVRWKKSKSELTVVTDIDNDETPED